MRGAATAPAPSRAAPRSIDALRLLTESERDWSADLRSVLAAAPTRAERHQRALVRTALNAYLDLVAREAPYAEPAAPLLRFPACTILAFLDLAASAADHRAVGTELTPHVASWLAGWRSCWEALSVDVEPTQVPGLAMSLAIAGPEPVVDVIPELRLHAKPVR